MPLSIPRYFILINMVPIEVSQEDYVNWKISNSNIINETRIRNFRVSTIFTGKVLKKKYLYRCIVEDLKGKVEAREMYAETLGEAQCIHYKLVQDLRAKLGVRCESF